MAIEVQKKKKGIDLPKGLDIFLQGMIALFAVMGIIYLSLLYLNAQVNEEKKIIEEQIEAKKAEIPEKQELERVAHEYRNLIEDFKLVSQNRNTFSLFFNPFEEMVHPSVIIFSTRVNLEESVVNFTGEAEDITVLGQQFFALKNNKNIESVTLSSMEIEKEEKRVVFSFEAQLKENFFIKETEKND